MRIEAQLPELAPALHAIAARAVPREAAGVITRAKHLVEMGNRDPEPESAFNLGPMHDLEQREGELLAIWHTHPEEQPPSLQDLFSCAATFLPWIIAGPTKLWVIHPEMRPYAGRDFVYGIDDCWALVSDWLAQERAIRLQWFSRPPDGWWETPGPSPYLDNAEAFGFSAIPAAECGFENLAVGDVILMKMAARRVNHAAVYIGGGHILHHVYGEISRPELLNARYQRMTTHICRHRDLTC